MNSQTNNIRLYKTIKCVLAETSIFLAETSICLAEKSMLLAEMSMYFWPKRTLSEMSCNRWAHSMDLRDRSMDRAARSMYPMFAQRSMNRAYERRGNVPGYDYHTAVRSPLGLRLGVFIILGVKTWPSTLETVYLCVFRRRH